MKNYNFKVNAIEDTGILKFSIDNKRVKYGFYTEWVDIFFITALNTLFDSQTGIPNKDIYMINDATKCVLFTKEAEDNVVKKYGSIPTYNVFALTAFQNIYADKKDKIEKIVDTIKRTSAEDLGLPQGISFSFEVDITVD